MPPNSPKDPKEIARDIIHTMIGLMIFTLLASGVLACFRLLWSQIAAFWS